jgi:putative PIN family toxin of toxin-antitoxin system
VARGRVELVLSEELLAELGRALAYPKLREHISPEDAADFIALLRSTASMPAGAERPDHISRDPGDDHLLALAKGSALVLVSGDRDLYDTPPSPSPIRRGLTRWGARLWLVSRRAPERSGSLDQSHSAVPRSGQRGVRGASFLEPL